MIQTHHNDTEDQHHHLSDVKLLPITCINKILMLLASEAATRGVLCKKVFLEI